MLIFVSTNIHLQFHSFVVTKFRLRLKFWDTRTPKYHILCIGFPTRWHIHLT